VYSGECIIHQRFCPGPHMPPTLVQTHSSTHRPAPDICSAYSASATVIVTHSFPAPPLLTQENGPSFKDPGTAFLLWQGWPPWQTVKFPAGHIEVRAFLSMHSASAAAEKQQVATHSKTPQTFSIIIFLSITINLKPDTSPNT